MGDEQKPELPEELYAEWENGDWVGEYRRENGQINAYPDRDEAWHPTLIGVHPKWRDQANELRPEVAWLRKANREATRKLGEADAEIARLKGIIEGHKRVCPMMGDSN